MALALGPGKLAAVMDAARGVVLVDGSVTHLRVVLRRPNGPSVLADALVQAGALRSIGRT